jgi:hypothetical protein
MATDKVRPDRGPAEGQPVQRQRAGRNNRLNALALVAVIGVVAVTGVMALMVANGTTDQSTGAEPTIRPTPRLPARIDHPQSIRIRPHRGLLGPPSRRRRGERRGEKRTPR